ncbi:MobF family relaxase [Providencia sp. PROV016]|uniref:MobF family relaxase n=3 Tax=unclassified Providencia TaxID=2633465 RepID=UPI00234AC983|nr:MobF family relaxase [Providencia sp. PROV016]
MLTLSRVSSASGAASYYEKEDNYYFLGDGSTQWFGKGAESLGLSGSVKRDDFQRVLEGKLPNGESLEHIVNNQNKHRPGYDLTFSAPKSVSVLALIEDKKDVLAAHNKAVINTLTELEKMASTRIMKSGIVSVEETNNIVAALFLHDTNRNLEPQVHTHAIIANVTETKEGNWKTLSADSVREINAFIETIWKNPIAYGSLYRNNLRPELESLGYKLIEVGKHGQFEISGVPTELFSSRGKEINEAVGKDATAKQKSIAAKDTRNKKDFTNIGEVKEQWKKTLSDTGFDHSKIINTDTTKSHRNDINNSLDVNDAIKTAIKNIGKESVKFTYDKLLSHVINSVSINKMEGVNNIREIIKDEIKQGHLVPLTENGNLFTTIEHLKHETHVVKNIGKLSNGHANLFSKSNDSISNYMTKNDSQFKSINLKGGASFGLNAIESISQLATENNKENLVIVPNNKTKLFFERESTSKLNLLTINEFESLDKAHLKNAIVSVYQIENMKLDKINNILNSTKGDGSIFVSINTNTKNSEGIFTDILKKNGNETFNIHEANENKNIYIVSDVDKSDRLKLATKQYLTLVVNNKDSIIQVSDNKTKDQVNKSIRETLIKNNLLSDNKVSINNEKQVFLTDSNRNLRNTYKSGLVLENTKEKERFKITHVDKTDNTLWLINDDGNKSKLAISDINKHYNLIEQSKIELRVGEKIKTYQGFGDVKGNSELTVSGIRKGNFLFREKVIFEDKDGNQVSFNTKGTGKLDYHYSETFGNSVNSDRTVIAILNKNDVSNTTINKLKMSGESVIAITGLSKKESESKINKVDVGVNYIPKNTGNILETISTIDSLKNSTISDLDKIINLSIEKSSNGKVYFNGATVIMNASNLNDKIPLNQLTDAIKLRIESGQLIPITTTALTDNYVKRETLNDEVNIVKKIFEGKGKSEPLNNGNISLEDTNLTRGQKAAGELILNSKDTIIAIQGYAGVGKTTQFKTVSQALKHTRPDIKLRGLAPTHKAVSELKSAGIESQTIASFLQEYSSTNTNVNYQNTVFVIDESSMIGNKGVSNLLDIISDNGGRPILSGDQLQHKSFESGAPFKLTLERSAIDHVVLDEIVRQSPELKPAVEAIIKGNVKDSLAVIEKVSPSIVPRTDQINAPKSSIVDLKENTPEEKIQIITEDFTSRTLEARNDTFVITPLNADRNAINESIHSALVANGSLKNSISIPTYQRVNSQEYELKSTKYWNENIGNVAKVGNNYFEIKSVDKEGIISLQNKENNHESALSTLEINSSSVAIYKERNIDVSVGEKLRITVTDIERNAFNNDMGVVKSIKDNQITMDFNGKEITYNPKEQLSERHLDYSYAITSYSSQGASIPYVIIYNGLEGGKRGLAALDSTYVEISRSKHHVQMYLDDVEKWKKHVEQNSGERATAHEILQNTDNQLAQQALKKWNESANITEKLSEKLPDSLADIAKYSGKTQEILLPVHDEFGVQRGNYHIPVGIFSGNLSVEQGHYEGAKDGSLIVLNRGDAELDTLLYPKNDIEKAINDASSNNTVIVKLNDMDQHEKPLSKNETKLQEAIDEMSQFKDEKIVDTYSDEKSEIAKDNLIKARDEIERDLDVTKETDVKEIDKRIRLDEENIVRHREEDVSSKQIDVEL